MTTLTSAQALTQLRNNPNQYRTPEALRALLAQVSVESTGRVTVLYSGSVGGVASTPLVAAMVQAGQDIRVLDKTESFKLLTNTEFKQAVAAAHGLNDIDKLEIRNTPANEFLNNSKTGLWANASERFAQGSTGDVRTITPNAVADRIFAQTELPKLLSNADVTHINGVPKEIYVAEFQRTGSLIEVNKMVSASSAELVRNMGYSSVLDANGVRTITAVDSTSLFKGTTYSGETIASGVRSSLSVPSTSVHIEGMAGISSGARIIGFIEGVANRAGAVAVGIGAAIAYGEAKAAVDSGDNVKAAGIVADWGAKLAVGFKAGVITAQAVGAATIGLQAIPVWGQAAHAAVIFAAGIGGALGGEALYDQTKKIITLMLDSPNTLSDTWQNLSDDIKRQILRFRGVRVSSNDTGEALDDAMANSVLQPESYALLDSGDFVRFGLSPDGKIESGDVLTGEYAGQSYERTWRQGNPFMQVGFVPTNDALQNNLDSITILTDGRGRTTTIDIAPIIQNMDGVNAVVGVSRFVGITQGLSPVSETYTEIQTQAGTGYQVTTTDTKLYTNGVLASRTESSNTTSASGLITVETIVKKYGQQNNLLETSTTTPQPDGSQTIVVQNGSGEVQYTRSVRYFDDVDGQSSLQTTTFPSGRTEILSIDTTGAPSTRIDTIPGSNTLSGNTETVNTYAYNSAGRPSSNPAAPQRPSTMMRVSPVLKISSPTTRQASPPRCATCMAQTAPPCRSAAPPLHLPALSINWAMRWAALPG